MASMSVRKSRGARRLIFPSGDGIPEGPRDSEASRDPSPDVPSGDGIPEGPSGDQPGTALAL
jgi:hypothetical protein